jgi:hypothetical protein
VLAQAACWPGAGHAAGPAGPVAPPAAGESGSPAAEPLVLEVFVREGCPHCADAKVFLESFARERPRLKILFRELGEDPGAIEDLIGHSRAAGIWPPGVPTFVVKGRVLLGFDSARGTGEQLKALVDGVAPAPGEVRTALFGSLSANELGLPLFTLALGLLDGFNPCAMWVLLFLLSLLVHLRDRRRMALVAGTFVLASGAVYYAFMAAWLNVFMVVGVSDPLRLALGSVALLVGVVNVKDFAAWGRGPSLSIPESAKPGLYARVRSVINARNLPAAMVAVAVLAVVVNFFELLCTAGLPAIYTAVLSQQGLGTAAYYGYLGLYILAYVADDALMVTIAVAAFGSRRLGEREGRWLKLVSGAVMLLLGAAMILRPELLR